MALVEWTYVRAAIIRSEIESGVGRIARASSGQSTIEYALVGALVVIAAAGAMTLLGDQVSAVFGRITTTLSSTSGKPAGS